MLYRSLAALFTLSALPFGCSSEPEPQEEMSAATPVYESERIVTTFATVVSVDPDHRKITLKAPQGNTFTCAVDERVRNLDQVKEGDQVALTYQEAAAVKVVKKAEKAERDEVVIQAPEGEKPKGARVEQTTMTAEIVGIDKARGTVTLRGQDGDVTTVTVRHPERLAGVKVGDLLWISYTQALAVSVEPAAGNQVR
jgi:hypothetical protein